MATAAAIEAAEEVRPIWLTLDEVAEKMRFPSRRSLLHYLRRNPAPVFQRIGSSRYFMRAEDVDRIMAPIDLPALSKRRIASAGASAAADDDPSAFVQVEPPPAAPGRRAKRPRSTKPAGKRSRQDGGQDAR